MDLGKWYLLVASNKYDEISKKSVNKILENINETTSATIYTPYKDFPTPTRMKINKGITYKQQSNTSDSSTKYRSWLTVDIIVASTITDITKRPVKRKRINIAAISYCDAANTVTSPITPLTPNNKSKSSLSTLTGTKVHDMIQSAVNTVMTK